MTVSLSFLDNDFNQNFLFCCVFLCLHELGLVGTSLKFIHAPSRTLYHTIIRVARTEKTMQNMKITQKLKSVYRVNHSNLAVFKCFFAYEMAKYTILNNKKK